MSKTIYSSLPNSNLTSAKIFCRSLDVQHRSYVLSMEDIRQVRQHLERPEIMRRPLVGNVLRHKIKTATLGAHGCFGGIVTGSCSVTWSVDEGPAETGLLSHRARAGIATGVIPVCSNLGAALIGMHVGERAPFLREDRTLASLRVLQVAALG